MKITKSFVLLTLIILIYPFLIKYNYVAHNQYEQIPLILRFLSHKYLENDWFINASSQFSPRVFFIFYIGTLSKFISLFSVYFINYLLMVTLVATATYRLSYGFYKSRFVSLLTTIVILFGQKFTLGGNDLIGRDLDPPRLAFSIVILGVAFLFERKYFLSAFFFSLASYVQPLIGFEVPLLFYLSIFISLFIENKTKSLKIIFSKLLKFSISVCLFFLLSSYSIYEYFISYRSQEIFIDSKNTLLNIILGARSPHYLPSSWPISLYSSFILFTLLFILFLIINFKTFSIFFKRILILTNINIFILFLIAYFFTEVYPLYNIVILQFFRLSVISYWLFAIVIYGGCFSFGESKLLNFKYKKLFLIPWVPYIISHFDVIFIPGRGNLLYIFLTALITLLFLRSITDNRKLLVILFTIATTSFIYRNYPLQITQLYSTKTAEIDIALFIRDHTPSNSIILTPPDFITFRLVANRAIIVDWLGLPYSRGDILEWSDRIKNVSGTKSSPLKEMTIDRVTSGYRKLNQNKLLDLKKKYFFNYVVLDKSSDIKLSKVYENDHYVVYNLPF